LICHSTTSADPVELICISRTLTGNWHVELFPALSVVVQVTNIVLKLKLCDPLSKTRTMTGEQPRIGASRQFCVGATRLPATQRGGKTFGRWAKSGHVSLGEVS